MRIRYNYWTQGISEIEGLLTSIDRLHKLRLQIGPIANELEFAEQKLAFVKEIETRWEKASSKAKIEAFRQVDEASVTAFRARIELELAQLKTPSSSEPPLSSDVPASRNAFQSPDRWEYKTCDGNGTGTDSPLELNRLGREGWELVSTICDNSAGAME